MEKLMDCHHLPMSTSEMEKDSDIEYLHFMESEFPMDWQIREVTRSDPHLSIMTYVNDSGPSQMEEDFKPFYIHRNELK